MSASIIISSALGTEQQPAAIYFLYVAPLNAFHGSTHHTPTGVKECHRNRKKKKNQQLTVATSPIALARVTPSAVLGTETRPADARPTLTVPQSCPVWMLVLGMVY
jgi:hypothetical protein